MAQTSFNLLVLIGMNPYGMEVMDEEEYRAMMEQQYGEEMG